MPMVMPQVMDIMMARTKPKIAMSYRAIGSGAGATEFAAGANAFSCGMSGGPERGVL